MANSKPLSNSFCCNVFSTIENSNPIPIELLRPRSQTAQEIIDSLIQNIHPLFADHTDTKQRTAIQIEALRHFQEHGKEYAFDEGQFDQQKMDKWYAFLDNLFCGGLMKRFCHMELQQKNAGGLLGKTVGYKSGPMPMKDKDAGFIGESQEARIEIYNVNNLSSSLPQHQMNQSCVEALQHEIVHGIFCVLLTPFPIKTYNSIMGVDGHGYFWQLGMMIVQEAFFKLKLIDEFSDIFFWHKENGFLQLLAAGCLENGTNVSGKDITEWPSKMINMTGITPQMLALTELCLPSMARVVEFGADDQIRAPGPECQYSSGKNLFRKTQHGMTLEIQGTFMGLVKGSILGML